MQRTTSPPAPSSHSSAAISLVEWSGVRSGRIGRSSSPTIKASARRLDVPLFQPFPRSCSVRACSRKPSPGVCQSFTIRPRRRRVQPADLRAARFPAMRFLSIAWIRLLGRSCSAIRFRPAAVQPTTTRGWATKPSIRISSARVLIIVLRPTRIKSSAG